MYRIRAVIGVDVSANSAPDLATTVIFTDPNLAGLTVQATHLDELRTAVDAGRVLAGTRSGGVKSGTLPRVPPQNNPITPPSPPPPPPADSPPAAPPGGAGSGGAPRPSLRP